MHISLEATESNRKREWPLVSIDEFDSRSTAHAAHVCPAEAYQPSKRVYAAVPARNRARG